MPTLEIEIDRTFAQMCKEIPNYNQICLISFPISYLFDNFFVFSSIFGHERNQVYRRYIFPTQHGNSEYEVLRQNTQN